MVVLSSIIMSVYVFDVYFEHLIEIIGACYA